MRQLRTWAVLLVALATTPRWLLAQWDWTLSVTDEVTYSHPRSDSLFNPANLLFEPETMSNHLLGSGRVSLKLRDSRVRLQVAGTERVSRDQGTHAEFLLREAYAVVTATEHWDFSVGKKLVKWGTGAAYNPSGFADPAKDPRDPNDRLGLNQGTELVQANYVRGQSSVDVIYFAPRLYFTRTSIRARDRLALRYNQFWRGLDFSAMALIPSDAPNRLGCNFSYVWGSSTELHGELVLLHPTLPQEKTRLLADLGLLAPTVVDIAWPSPQDARRLIAQSVLGGNYTFRNAWTLTGEWHHDGQGLSSGENGLMFSRLQADSGAVARALAGGGIDDASAFERLAGAAQRLPGIRQNRDTFFLMGSTLWGHEKYSFQVIALSGWQDHSTTAILGFGAQLHRNWQFYLRPSFFLGKRRSEYGSQIYDSAFAAGLRYNL